MDSFKTMAIPCWKRSLTRGVCRHRMGLLRLLNMSILQGGLQ